MIKIIELTQNKPLNETLGNNKIYINVFYVVELVKGQEHDDWKTKVKMVNDKGIYHVKETVEDIIKLIN